MGTSENVRTAGRMATGDWRCDGAEDRTMQYLASQRKAGLYSVIESRVCASASMRQPNLITVRPLGDNGLTRVCYCLEVAGMGLMCWLCRWLWTNWEAGPGSVRAPGCSSALQAKVREQQTGWPVQRNSDLSRLFLTSVRLGVAAPVRWESRGREFRDAGGVEQEDAMPGLSSRQRGLSVVLEALEMA